MATYCAFDDNGRLQAVIHVQGPARKTAREHFGSSLPSGFRTGIYESQEMLPESKLEICCGSAGLVLDGAFRVDPLNQLEQASWIRSLHAAEARLITLTLQISVLSMVAEDLGDHSLTVHQQLEVAMEGRDEALQRLRSGLVGRGSVDKNLANIAGQLFRVRLDELSNTGTP